MKNRIKAGILGFVVADALGVPAEFKSRQKLMENPVTDMTGFGTHKQPLGTWSDDSSMTIATMDSIISNNGINYRSIMDNFVAWISKAKYTAGDVTFDYGITTANAINNYYGGMDPVKSGMTGERDNGNGSLMRILPFVFYNRFKNNNKETSRKAIRDASSLTHGHEISILGCQIYSDYVNLLLDGLNKMEALEIIKSSDYEGQFVDSSINYYKRILDGSIATADISKVPSSGFVVDTLEASIWCLINSDNYKEAVLKAVNLGNDTDTVGAVCGSLCGIYYGLESIPDNWINSIIRIDYINELIESFCNTILG